MNATIAIGMLIAAFVVACILAGHSQRPKPPVQETRKVYTANGHKREVTFDGRIWVVVESVDKTRIRNHRRNS